MTRRKTNAEFRQELFNVQGNMVIPLEKYKNCRTKIKVKCRNCGFVWRVYPSSLYEGCGCPRCDVRRRRETDSEFRKKLHKIHKNAIIPLEKYKGMNNKIKVKCRHCGFVWKVLPLSLCRGSGCPCCASRNQRSRRRKPNIEFKKELYKIRGNAIIPLEKYKGVNTKIKVKCHHCGYVWKARPANLYEGSGCPHCAACRRRKTNLEFRKKLHKAQGNTIIPLEKYKDIYTKIRVKCRHCGFLWKACPANLYKGHGCPHCASINRRKTNTEFKQELFNIQGNTVIPLEKYKNCHTKIKVKCRRCEHVWRACPDDLLKGCGCPRCNRNSSYGEKYVYHYLRHHLRVHFGYGHIIPANGLHLDFWIPSMKLAIEFDGTQHFRYVPYFCNNNPKRFKESVHRDCYKNYYCLRHHITLIRIQNFHNNSNYSRLRHITYHILSRVFSAYRHHRLHTHIYRFDVNHHGYLLHNHKRSA